MSKNLKILVALLAALAIATPALALEADFGGFLQVRGIAFDDLDGNDDIDDNAAGVDSRFRLYNTNAINENFKVVFKLEVDYFWGDSALGKPGADETGELEVKNIYMDFNVLDIATNFKVGTHFYKLGRGILLFDDNSGITTRTEIVPGAMNLGLYWVKAVEDDIFDDSADQDYYHVQLDFENVAGAWHVGPYLAYADFGDDDEAWYAGVDVDGKLGPVGLAFTGIYNDWEDDDTNTDGNGYVLFAKGTYKMGAIDLSAEAAAYGDEDRADGRFRSVRSYNNFAEIISGGRFDGRGTVGSNQTVTSSTTGAPYTPNWMYFKLGGATKLDDKNSVSAYYIYAEEAEGLERTMGHEIDAYYDYMIDKGLTFTVGGAYLFADDDFGAGDDAWKAGTALTAKF